MNNYFQPIHQLRQVILLLHLVTRRHHPAIHLHHQPTVQQAQHTAPHHLLIHRPAQRIVQQVHLTALPLLVSTLPV